MMVSIVGQCLGANVLHRTNQLALAVSRVDSWRLLLLDLHVEEIVRVRIDTQQERSAQRSEVMNAYRAAVF